MLEGSVKNILGRPGQSPFVFEYSDSYSVFDWGRMPDILEHKGESLAYMGDLFFRLLADANRWKNWQLPESLSQKLQDNKTLINLKTKGLKHHCIGLVEIVGDELKDCAMSNCLAVKPVEVIHPKLNPELDYSVYQQKLTNTLVPLEVVFRFSIPDGSSLISRIENDEQYCREIGLTKQMIDQKEFVEPIIEFSTKLESTDRYISYKKAAQIAGLCDQEFQNLHDLVVLTALFLKDVFKGVGVELCDGKFEFAFSSEVDAKGLREFMLVDSIGPDELRITYRDIQLSKENLRKIYRQTAWYPATSAAKGLAQTRGVQDWQTICTKELGQSPPNIDSAHLETFSQMYKVLTNRLAQEYFAQVPFEQAWDMETLIDQLQKRQVS